MVCVIGEALIDLVADRESAQRPGPQAYLAHPGGSPYNVAIGLARLGRPTALQARLSRDAFGRQLRAHAEANGVDLSLAIDAPEPSTLAIVGLDEQRNATYDFYLNGTADWQWTASELDRAPKDGGWIHTGSLASWTEPGASVIGKHLARRRGAGATVSFDPNIRPLLMPDHAAAVACVEELVRLADVVKASAEDLEWLYPGRGLSEVMPAWQALGPSIVAVTDGARGAHGVGPAGSIVTVPALKVEVIDTVGAGDAFMA
ncbi:MAG: fructokinase, partial [Pseudonocardiales bacterium]|nr:fructokinase [Pseudonocardiales bacterium]